jgi:glycosyltransferase involved in cell wall biosynthesis
MKILSVQPSSNYVNGGSGRVLRRLFKGREADIHGVYLSIGLGKDKVGAIRETKIVWHPVNYRWVQWKLRPLFSFLRRTIGLSKVNSDFLYALEKITFDIAHVINHGELSSIYVNSKWAASKPLWASFHDHYSLCSNAEDANKLWNKADRRFCISDELGAEYQKQFGNLPFELVTDGIYTDEVSSPISNPLPEKLIVYFAGLLHIDYYQNFEALADTLELLAKDNFKVSLILRGTQKLDFLVNRNFEIIYRTDFVSDEAIKKELDEATILYFPMKFNVPEFYMYSLSTKMIGYLAAKGVIFYHGPQNSAAVNLLNKWDAAINSYSLNPVQIRETLLAGIRNSNKLSSNAKDLAKSQFDMEKILEKFWSK